MIPMQTKHEEIRCKYTNLILYLDLLHVFFFFVQRNYYYFQKYYYICINKL